MRTALQDLEYRYRDDALFHQLVRTIEHAIENLELTPSEVRAAAMMAAFRVEQRTPFARPIMRELQAKQEADAHLMNLILKASPAPSTEGKEEKK